MLVLALLATFQSADTVRYEAAFPNAPHHEAEITITVPARGLDTVEVRMSRSSPGRYALHEFAKNVYNVRAVDGAGRRLAIIRDTPYGWRVTGHDGTVRVSYTLFADRAGGTYTGIDATHAHMNMPATFAWVPGTEHLPIRVDFDVPSSWGWRAATQLLRTDTAMRFTAPHLQYFFDSPTELSDQMVRSWTVAGPAGRVDTIHLAVHHLGTAAEVDAYAEMAKKVVAEQVGIYGETARYDNGNYTFIADYLPWVSGDGMEHRNSTILSSTGSLGLPSQANPANSIAGAFSLLGTLSHEFFHSWNVERIRPAMLEPFDFREANPSDALWFAEGFTSYFDDLTIRRAGLMNDAQYAAGLGSVVDAVVNAPARRYGSPMEMSLRAPFLDAATSIDPTNNGNIFLSYYTWGAGIGLGLDLTIRSRFPGKTLDGFMRTMWQEFGVGPRYEVAHPYTVDDLERTLGSYLGDAAFARDFFRRYIRGSDVVDYAGLLALAGVRLQAANPGAAWLGPVRLASDSSGTVLDAAQVGTPIYEAGVERGDRILDIDGVPVRGTAALRALIASHAPGDLVAITFEQRGRRQTASVRLIVDPRVRAVPVESDGGTLTAEQRRFRGAWLASRAQ